MKKIIFICCLLGIFSLTSQATNLIPNGDMSSWSKTGSNYNPLPNNYTKDTGANNSHFSIGSEKFGKNNQNTLQLLFKNDDSPGTSRFFSTPYMNLSPGITYEFTFYVKGSGFVRSVSLCNKQATNEQRRSANSSDNAITQRPFNSATSEARLFEEWTPFILYFTVPVAGEYNLNIANNNRNGNDNIPFMIAGLYFENVTNRVAANYYIDSFLGDDTNEGTSSDAPWKNLSKVNSRGFVGGDTIFFAKNSVWLGNIAPKGSGSAGKSIVISSYGTGHDPLLIGNSTGAVVSLNNQSYWEITNLEITNDASTEGDRRGVEVKATNAGVVNHIHLKDLHIHHIKGIPGDGMAEKRTAGIFIVVEDDATTPTRFHDILIEGCHIHHADNQGLALQHEKFKDYPGEGTWDNNKFTQVIIRNNIIHDISKNAMIVRMTEDGIVEKNICFETATRTQGNTMFSRNVSTTTFRYNEGFRNIAHAHDGCMYDPDLRSLETYWQDSYSHDNAHGLAWFCTEEKDKIFFRSNISQNDKGYLVYINYEFKEAEVSGNIFHVGKLVDPYLIREHATRKHGTTIFKNNVIYNESDKLNFEYDPQARINAGINLTNRQVSGNIYKNKALLNPKNIAMGKAANESGLANLKKYHRGFIKSDIIDNLTNHTVDIFVPAAINDVMIGTVNGIPAYKFELEREKRRLRPLLMYENQSTTIDEEELESAAASALLKIKIQQYWMIQKNLPEGNIVSAVEQLRKKENNFRKNNTDNSLVVIGPDYYQEDAFFDYFFANAAEALKKVLVESEIAYTQQELQAHYLVGDLDRTSPVWANISLDYYKSAVVRSLVDKKYKEFMSAQAAQADIVIFDDTNLKREVLEQVSVFVNSNKQINVSGLPTFAQIKVFDIFGRLVERTENSGQSFITKPFQTGIYILSIKALEGEKNIKCFVK